MVGWIGGAYLLVVGYMFLFVEELSESGWWVIFSTFLPVHIFAAKFSGSGIILAFGIWLALILFFLKKPWRQIVACLLVAVAASVLPLRGLSALPILAAALAVGTHFAFFATAGRGALRQAILGCIILGLGMATVLFVPGLG